MGVMDLTTINPNLIKKEQWVTVPRKRKKKEQWVTAPLKEREVKSSG